MIFIFGENKIDVDVERTKAFYRQADIITNGCSCDGCNNYLKAIEVFPQKVHSLFEELGVDIKKAAEIITYCSENNGTSIFYGGFYHICGKLLSNTDVWTSTEQLNTDTVLFEVRNDVRYVVEEGYAVGFCTQCSLLEDNFPLSAIQMEIEFHVPWVLEKKNSYR